jgi:hypothetical protein
MLCMLRPCCACCARSETPCCDATLGAAPPLVFQMLFDPTHALHKKAFARCVPRPSARAATKPWLLCRGFSLLTSVPCLQGEPD